MSDKPDEQLVDMGEIVGDPPAGDAFLGDFVSNDQSAAGEPAGDTGSDDESEDES